MNSSLLSVIVVTYKHGDMLYETLDSVFIQDYSKMQLIIAEDGDSDFSAEEVKKYIKAKAKENIISSLVIQSKENRGTVRNLNSALSSAKGEYIKIIAGDDAFDNKQVFQKQVTYLQNNPHQFFVVGNIVECDPIMKPLRVKGFSPDGVCPLLEGAREDLLKYMCRKNPAILSTQAICFTRRFFQEQGAFDEAYRLIEDLPMAVKTVSSGIPFGYIDWPCVRHRGSVGVSTSNNAFDSERLAYYEDLLTYYNKALAPVEETVGKVYVRMRRQLIQFRIEYAKLKQIGAKPSKRLSLITKNIIPILYYTITQFKRMVFYFSK